MIRQFILIFFMCLMPTLAAQEAQPKAEIKQILANHETTLRWPMPNNWKHPVRFEIKAGERILGRGTAKSSIIDDAELLSIKVLVESRSINSITDCDITLSCANDSIETPGLLFPEHPLADCRKTLESINIQIFDPAGKTASVFNDLQVPFEQIKSIQDLKQISKSLLVIGESYDQYDEEFSKSLAAASRNGVNIICLSPADSEFNLQIDDQVVLSQTPNIADVGSKIVVAPGLFWQPIRSDATISLVPAKRKSGWPWIELRTNVPKQSRLIVCGFPMIASHNKTPAARHLLAKLLIGQTRSAASEIQARRASE